jgi:hypothetical protein
MIMRELRDRMTNGLIDCPRTLTAVDVGNWNVEMDGCERAREHLSTVTQNKNNVRPQAVKSINTSGEGNSQITSHLRP